MASRKQPSLSARVAGWNVQAVVAGGNGVFGGSSRVVKRITVSAAATGSLRLLWNNGSSAVFVVTGSGGFTLEPQGQYDWDYDFTVDCGLVVGATTLVEFCEL